MTRFMIAVGALVLAAGCGGGRPRGSEVQTRVERSRAVGAARLALAGAEKQMERLDYEGAIRTLSPHQDAALPVWEATRLKHVLGAAHYYTGDKLAAARVFGACPPTLLPDEFPPSLVRYYQRHAGQSIRP